MEYRLTDFLPTTKKAKGNGEQLIGSPAIDPKIFFKAAAVTKRLPDMYKELAALRKEIEELKKDKS